MFGVVRKESGKIEGSGTLPKVAGTYVSRSCLPGNNLASLDVLTLSRPYRLTTFELKWTWEGKKIQGMRCDSQANWQTIRDMTQRERRALVTGKGF